MPVTVAGHAEGFRAAVQLRQLAENPRVGTLADGQAPLRQQVQELAEGFLNFVDIPVAVQMIRINVQHHRHGGAHLQEAAAELAGLRQEGLPLADAGGAADGVQLAADVDGGIRAPLHQDLAEHGGGGGFAVSSAHTHRLPVALHQLAQERCPLHGRDAQPLRLYPLGVVGGDGGGVHHQIRPMDVLRPMAHEHLRALVAHVTQQIPFRPVRAGHPVALVNEHLRQPRHAGAADADHMDSLACIVTDVGCLHPCHSLPA